MMKGIIFAIMLQPLAVFVSLYALIIHRVATQRNVPRLCVISFVGRPIGLLIMPSLKRFTQGQYGFHVHSLPAFIMIKLKLLTGIETCFLPILIKDLLKRNLFAKVICQHAMRIMVACSSLFALTLCASNLFVSGSGGARVACGAAIRPAKININRK